MKTKHLLLLLLMPVLLFQCDDIQDPSCEETCCYRTLFIDLRAKSSIPFETEESLTASGATSLDKKSDIVHYKVMRNLAMKEIVANYSEVLQIKDSFALSEYPVIIYNYDSRPAYYEFIVLQNNQPISTVTTFADKKTDDILAFLLPYVRDFSQYDNNDDFFIGLYPGNPYLGDASNYGQTPASLYDKAENRTVEALPVSDIQKLEDLYAMMPDEDKQEIGIGKDLIRQEIIQEEEEGRAFWDAKFVEFNKLINQSDEEIFSTATSGKTNSTIYTTPHYGNNCLERTYWNVACGPAVTAWIYRGFESYYNNTYIRVHGNTLLDPQFIDEGNLSRWQNEISRGETQNLADLNAFMGNSDGGLLHRIYDRGNTTWSGLLAGMTWPTGMNRALKDVTNSTYKFSYVINIHLHIKNKKLPAYRVIGVGGGSLHYICEFATKKVGNKKWFYVTDNGFSMTQRPYWRNDTQAQWGLKYGVNNNNTQN